MYNNTVKKPKKKKSKSSDADYVDNQALYAALVDYKKKLTESENNGRKKPKLPDYIGECILKIASRLSYRPNFANYPYRDEMVSDAVLNCVPYIDNFDPTKSKNPFAYFTQIIYFAFVRRITKEKKQTFVKMKMLEKMDTKGNIRRLLKDGIASADEFYEKENNQQDEGQDEDNTGSSDDDNSR